MRGAGYQHCREHYRAAHVNRIYALLMLPLGTRRGYSRPVGDDLDPGAGFLVEGIAFAFYVRYPHFIECGRQAFVCDTIQRLLRRLNRGDDQELGDDTDKSLRSNIDAFRNFRVGQPALPWEGQSLFELDQDCTELDLVLAVAPVESSEVDASHRSPPKLLLLLDDDLSVRKARNNDRANVRVQKALDEVGSIVGDAMCAPVKKVVKFIEYKHLRLRDVELLNCPELTFSQGAIIGMWASDTQKYLLAD